MALRFFDSPQKDFECSKCDEGDQNERGCVPIELVREDYNDEMSIHFYWSELIGKDVKNLIGAYDDIYCYVCPKAVIRDETYELISLYSLCKQMNCLPYDGGLNAQPAALVEAFTIISSEISRLERKHLDKKDKDFGKK